MELLLIAKVMPLQFDREKKYSSAHWEIRSPCQERTNPCTCPFSTAPFTCAAP